MEPIVFIVIVFYIVKAIKQAGEAQGNEAKKKNTTYQAPKQRSQYQQAVRETIVKARQLAQASPGELYEQLHVSDYVAKQVKASGVESRNTTILQRAQANTEKAKADVTLQTMEAEHNHSERVSAAEHHHPEDVMPENMLGNIEDLMIKGYDGKLCFERDFLGEAMDMISHFTVPSEVPDFSKDDVA